MNRSIPFFDYPSLFLENEKEITEVLLDVMRRGAYILQQDLAQFEQNLSDYLNVKHVLGVADGTNALKLALMAAGVGPGEEVILPAHTYVASAAAIHYAGAKPILVECGADHLIDADAVRKAITPKTRAILPVHLNGRTAAMPPLQHLADEFSLCIIEDAAQALGSKYGDEYAGTFGSAGAFSFYPAKLLGCFGDGGAIVTNDDSLHEKLRLLRDHGRNEDGEVIAWGTNCRLDNLQAAVLDFKLRKFNQAIARRRALAARYQAGLGDCKDLTLPPAPTTNGAHFDVYQNYEIEAEGRDKLKHYLEQNGVRTIVQFGGKAIHQHAGLGFDGTTAPFTERLYKRMLLLPMNMALKNDDVDYVIDQVTRFYQRN